MREIEKQFEKAQVARNNGQINEAISGYEKVRKEAQAQNDHNLAAECLHMIGVAYKQEKQYPQAEKALQDALMEFEKLDQPVLIGAVLRDLGDVALYQENYPKAQNLLEQSITTLAKTDNLGHLGISKVKLGVVKARQGDVEVGEAIIKEGIADISQSPDQFFESTGYFNLAEVQKQAGKLTEARGSLAKAQEILDSLGSLDEFQERRKQISNLLKELGNII